jgi:hypothetical protein
VKILLDFPAILEKLVGLEAGSFKKADCSSSAALENPFAASQWL